MESIIINNTQYNYIYRDGKKVKLGEGGGGEVFLVEKDGKEYAVKEYERQNKRVKNEIDFYKKYSDCTYIIKVYGSKKTRHGYFLLMEKYTCSLRDIIESKLSLDDKFKYMFQLISAVKFIHVEAQVIHRDLKPENILIDTNGNIHLADFEIAYFADKPHVTRKNELLANKSYIAPELYDVDEKKYTFACDVFSLGKIIIELFTGTNPGGTNQECISDTYPELQPLDTVLNKMMRQNPFERPSISDIEIDLNYKYGQINHQLSMIIEQLNEQCKKCVGIEHKEELLKVAALDLMKANTIVKSRKLLGRVNTNYHSNIHWKVRKEYINYYFQIHVLEVVKNKFIYESNIYKRGQEISPPIDPLGKDKELYNKLETILEQVERIPSEFRNLSCEIKKYFASCFRYHCEEIIERIESPEFVELYKDDLLDVPIMYFVEKCYKEFLKDAGNDTSTIDEILLINLNKSSFRIEESRLINNDNIEVLELLHAKYDCVSDINQDDYCFLRFREAEYKRFKRDVEEYYEEEDILKYDVQDFMRTEKHFGGAVEIEVSRNYDINLLKNVIET